MIKNHRVLITTLLIFLVTSCISVSDMMGDEDLESVEPNDEIGQLLSDIQDEQFEMSDTQNEPTTSEKLETSDEQLDPSPTEKYDSVLLDNSDEPKESEAETIQETSKEVNQNFNSFENTIAKLSIDDKIQYRVATINFYSGSSTVDNIGLKNDISIWF